jgi:hypothetical protein
MTSLSRIDLLRAQLQAQLQRRSASRAPTVPQAAQHRDALPLSQLRSLKAHGTDDPRALTTALVQDVLEEFLGKGMTNDPEFQNAVQMIADDLSADPALSALCVQCIEQA